MSSTMSPVTQTALVAVKSAVVGDAGTPEAVALGSDRSPVPMAMAPNQLNTSRCAGPRLASCAAR